ncbi:MAG: hypothetical protein P1U85_04395 [Verrucomicrobiales bacterium]|nr:hypothetical protein [Verrucomicrobiales bacterium]
MPDTTDSDIDAFIDRWGPSGGRERANYQLFLTELCDLLDLPHPEPAQADASENAYTFDRAITHTKADGTSAPRFIDLYKTGCFVLETKQGVEAAEKADSTGLSPSSNPVKSATGHGKRGTAGYDKTMTRAHAQAEGYIHDLPAGEGRPPFLIVCDIGYVFELYAEFTQSGGRYQRFPDPKNHRIYLEDLRKPEIRERLRTIWTDPLSLDPAKRIAKVTRDIADRLARLAKSLEAEKHDPETVAIFLQRCLFTMFAEDIGLLPEKGFEQLLDRVDENPASFPTLVGGLWKEMAEGTDYSPLLLQKISHFNGGLFENASALPLTGEQVELLRDAAHADWTEVDPAIFGTLLERAPDPRERHKLGAHYTPRSYVERLIEPTVIEPLRTQWESVKAAAVLLLEQDKGKKAREEVETFHHDLCRVRVLDPACGSGNFLYVTLEHMKQLEAEVLDFFERIGGDRTLEMDSFKVRPDQFWGMELNRSAVSIAQLVLWIGYFQWHFKTTGRADTNDRPLLPKQNTILHQDAVLAYDEKIPRRDEEGNVVQIWDGVTTKPHPVTGKEVPDETAKKVLYDFTNPRRPDWPEADYVVGNPPFVGASRMRDFLGDGYTEAVRKAWKGDVPESADFVMYWWEKCARLLREEKIERFGLITTNSIHQTFNRRVLEKHLGDEKKPMHLAFAIPDHPWVDSSDGAAVRIAMTVGSRGNLGGKLGAVIGENADKEEIAIQFSHGCLLPTMSIGADFSEINQLQANASMSSMGMKLHGKGFLLASDHHLVDSDPDCVVIKEFVGSRDLTQKSRKLAVIDAFEFDEQCLAESYPGVYQHLLTEVKPERDAKSHTKDGAAYAKLWWKFGKPRPLLRKSLGSMESFIATPRTAKFRTFLTLSASVVPESEVVCIFSDEFSLFGILSSSTHQAWSLATCGWMGKGNDPRYNNSRCFETFPFPDPDPTT